MSQSRASMALQMDTRTRATFRIEPLLGLCIGALGGALQGSLLSSSLVQTILCGGLFGLAFGLFFAKRATSPYRPGVRSEDWLKIKVRRTLDAVVGAAADRQAAPVAIAGRVGAVDDDGCAFGRGHHVGRVHGVALDPFDRGARAGLLRGGGSE